MKHLKISLLLLAWSVAAGALSATPQHYTNHFDSEGFPEMSVSPSDMGLWTLGKDDVNIDDGKLRYRQYHPSKTGAVVAAGAVQLTGWEAADFVITTQFNVQFNRLTNNTTRTSISAFGNTSTFLATPNFPSYNYRAEWNIGGGGGDVGEISLRSMGGQDLGFTASPAINIGHGVRFDSYELRLAGNYVGSTLHMTFSVFNITGGTPALLGTVTASDTSPLTGDWFGVWSRTNMPNPGSLTLDYDNFAVIPEPSTVAFLSGGIIFAIVLLVRRRHRA